MINKSGKRLKIKVNWWIEGMYKKIKQEVWLMVKKLEIKVVLRKKVCLCLLKKNMWIGIPILLPHRFHKVLSLREYVAWFWIPHREIFVDTSNFYNLVSR